MGKNITLFNQTLCTSDKKVQHEKSYLLADFIICDFETNHNSDKLNRDTIESWMETLVGQPIVGRIAMTDDGIADFSDHRFYNTINMTDDGKPYIKDELDTEACGVFTSVKIEDISGKEYIVAQGKLWKRFHNFSTLVEKRINEGTLKTSWEVNIISSHKETENGEKICVIDQGEFIGHCLLGNHVAPAYDESCVLNVASVNKNTDTELLNALNKDFIKVSNIEKKEEEEEKLEESKITTSALTDRDIDRLLRKAIESELDCDYWEYSTFYHFPTEKTIWVHKWSDNETAMIIFTYDVDGEEVKIMKMENAELTATIPEMNNTIAQLKDDISVKNEALIISSAEVARLNDEITSLSVFKEKFEEVEQKRISAELKKSQEELVDYALSSNLITSDEIKGEFKEMIDKVDTSAIKSIIAERYVHSLENTKEVSNTLEQSTNTATANLANYGDRKETFGIKEFENNFLKFTR